jgi:LPS sulfotransferase NodH
MSKFEWLFRARTGPAKRMRATRVPILKRPVRNDLIHPPADWDFPRRTIMIVGMPRSGTNYLCRAMANTGVLGHPVEAFVPEVASQYDARRGHDATFQLTLPNTVGRSDNAIAAVKIFTFNLDQISRRANLLDFYPNPVFVYMHRRDILGQAISFVRGLQTWRWISHDAEEREPQYSADQIHGALMKLAISEARWKAYFARNDIEPLEVCYEDLLGNEEAVLREIARRVGLDASEGPITFQAPDLSVQRDALTAEWRARFIAERADPNWLERPVVRKRVSRTPRNLIWLLFHKLQT